MNEKKQAEGGRRHGYMGHLTRIANCIVHSTDKGPNSAAVQQLIKDLPDEVRERWETFCTSSLGETNKRNTVDLVGFTRLHFCDFRALSLCPFIQKDVKDLPCVLGIVGQG